MNIKSSLCNWNTEKVLLLLILLLAAILRFWNYPAMPYMHDELSALARAQFHSFSDLIKYGVYTDTHPAGVQIFIYYWIKLFGDNEMSVKLPFILAGIFAIYFSFKIAKLMFNGSVALITASFMAVLQYTVMYSQLARPYSAGLFFSVWMVWCWCNYFFDDQPNKIKWLVGYVIAAALCAYVHNFSLLFAAIVGLTGLFFLDKKIWKAYILAGIAVFLLYIPHLPVFFHQFSKGGLGGADGWLGKPGNDWIFIYLEYIFHFSWWMYSLVLILIAVCFVAYRCEQDKHRFFRYICFAWFFILFLTGFLYSILVNPVIQFSLLIFAFPFLLMFMFSYMPELKGYYKILLTILILTTGTLTLALQRKHFQVFYKQPYQEYVKNTCRFLDEIKDTSKVTIEMSLSKYPLEHYFNKYHKRFNSIYYDVFEGKPDNKAFRNFINSLKTDYFIFGNPPLVYVQIIKEKYPFIVHKDEGFSYTWYCFSRTKPVTEVNENVLFSMNNCLTQMFPKQQTDRNMQHGAVKLHKEYLLDSAKEFSNIIQLPLKDMLPNHHNILNVSATILCKDTFANPSLVAEIKDKDKLVAYFAVDYQKFNNEPGGWNKVYLSEILPDDVLLQHPNAVARIYVWNKGNNNCLLNKFNIEVVACNPWIYGLYEVIRN